MHLIAPRNNANINQSAREKAVFYVTPKKNIDGSEIELVFILKWRAFSKPLCVFTVHLPREVGAIPSQGGQRATGAAELP